MIKKKFIDANQLLLESYQLAAKILESGFRPNFIVGVWRGGTPVGIAVQELLDYCGVETDHIAIRTSSYSGINQQERTVRVHGLSYIIKNVNAEDKLLIVDDVFDTGLSIEAIIQHLQKRTRKNMPHVAIATTYYKPNKNKTDRVPDFYVHESDEWLVFPHEVSGLSDEEIHAQKPELFELLKKLPKKDV